MSTRNLVKLSVRKNFKSFWSSFPIWFKVASRQLHMKKTSPTSKCLNYSDLSSQNAFSKDVILYNDSSGSTVWFEYVMDQTVLLRRFGEIQSISYGVVYFQWPSLRSAGPIQIYDLTRPHLSLLKILQFCRFLKSLKIRFRYTYIYAYILRTL